MRLIDLPTPALCVDVEALDANLATMAAFLRNRPCALRPHFKAHKTPAIAKRQAEAGCVGFTCATLDEAEVLAQHGFDDLLIANEVVDPRKRERLHSLAARVSLGVAVDSPTGAAFLEGSAAWVLLDVNIGLPRCGVMPPDADALAREIVRRKLRLRGVMGYEGHAMAVAAPDARADIARAAIELLVGVADSLRRGGFDIEIVSAGGTATYDLVGTFPGVTELQAGSYALMDTYYGRYGLPFREALRCLATVQTVQGPLAVLDAGLKALAVDHGNPELPDDSAASVLFLSDEHATLAVADGFEALPGERMWLRPSHVDPTVNLHDRLFAYRGDAVVAVWPVAARGYRQ